MNKIILVGIAMVLGVSAGCLSAFAGETVVDDKH